MASKVVKLSLGMPFRFGILNIPIFSEVLIDSDTG